MTPEIAPVQVDTAHGPVRGQVLDGVTRFLGIPYADRPFGRNRMRPPQPVAAWTNPRDCSEFGPTSPKGDYPPHYQPLLPEVIIPGEDCLNLNVWTADVSASLPVLVWIHGGSFMNGSGSVAEYDGTAFARDGVVTVTINYRLAAEGFLSLGDGIANLGLQDQVAALRWVNENISAFGGDPGRVTVAGESAGAMSVCTLLSMPAASGLFQQAIAQSGAASHTLTLEQGEMVGAHLADALGIEATREAFTELPLERLVTAAVDLVTEVRSVPDPLKWGSIAMTMVPFGPVVDGDTLPEHPLDAMASGASSEVPLMIGSNLDEARLFMVAPGVLDLVDEPTFQRAARAQGLSESAIQTYRDNRPGASPGDVLAATTTDWFFAIPALRVAETRIGAGAAPTWVYRFDYPDTAANKGLGAAHGVEIPYVFGTHHGATAAGLVGPDPSDEVASATHGAWVDFITAGSPGWAPYDLIDRPVGVIRESITQTSDPSGDERALWVGIR